MEHTTTLAAEGRRCCLPSSTERSDYRYRTTVTRSYWLAKVLAQACMIDYENFKCAIPDADYHDACQAVWAEMHKLQPGSNPWKRGQMSPYNHY